MDGQTYGQTDGWTEFLPILQDFVPCRGLLEGSEGLLEGSEGLLEGSEGWLEGSEGQLEGSEGQPAGSEGQPAGSEGQPEGGRMDGRMDGRTDGRNFSLFYRTLSSVGAAALLPFETSPHQGSRTRVPLTS